MRTSLILLLAALASVARGEVVYEKDIAPILRMYCVGCHNAEEHENAFSVETFAALKKGGEEKGEPIKPGDAENSLLIKLIEKRARPHMPPKDEPQVPAAELEILKKWIAEGARGPKVDESILESLVVPKVAVGRKNRAPISAASYSADGKLLAIARNGAVEVGKKRFTGIPGKVNSAHFSRDGRQLIAAGGITGLSGVAKLWDMQSGSEMRAFTGHRDALYDGEISPDGKTIATAGYDRLIKLWDTDGKLLRTINVHNGAIFDLAFDPSGKVLASASADQTVKLWRVSDGTRLDTLNQPQGELNCVTFTADGEHILAAGADKRIHMWRFVSRESPALNPVVHSRFAHEAAITAIALSGDGKDLLTAAADRTLKVWSLPDLTEQFAYETQSDLVASMAARNEQFTVARLDGSVETYRIKTSPQKKQAVIAKTETKASTGAANMIEVKGVIERAGEADEIRFRARAGEEMTLIINAAQSKSPLDSRIEVLHADGKPVEQVVLQATRDSWFTFRGKDSDQSDDFRLHNWAEMELNEYLYCNGEVVKLWLYPRGPDSGYKVYPGEGKRHTAFNTTGITHALNEPCYIVNPLPPGSQPAPNGLPIFKLNYENDDDPYRRNGTDSLLLFTAPKAGEYIARVTDVRGFGGTNFNYTLTIRERRPDFSIAVSGMNPQVSPGSGREIRFVATRTEGFEGPIQIDVSNLPAGFWMSSPIEIEAGQIATIATIYADKDARAPEASAAKAAKVVARASIKGREVSHDAGSLGEIKLGKPAKVTVEIMPGPDRSYVKAEPGKPLEFSIRPGQTISAHVRATRHDFKDRIEFGNEDSGRNLPHGVYVDNIGLNGLLIVEGQSERDFFITAAKMAKPGRRTFHLRATADDGQVSLPAILNVLPAEPTKMAAAQKAE